MISVQNLGLHFAGKYLFEKVTFRINKSNRIGLAGKNGAGKSTLLKILAGEEQATEGGVNLEGQVSIGFLKQDLEFEKGRTVWEEAKQAFKELNAIHKRIEEINKEFEHRTDYESESYNDLIHELSELTERFSLKGGYTIDGDIEKVLKGLGFKLSDFNQLTDLYSGGWRMRIELAKLLLQQHDVLLLDEPTNHLDIESILWLEDFLQNYNGAIMLVSHDKQFLTNVCNRTIEISNKSIQDYQANYEKYLLLRKERREQLFKAQKNQDQEIKHTEELIEKFRYKASKASFAQSLIKKLDRIDRIEIEDEDITRFNIRFEPAVNSGKVVFKAENLAKHYGDKLIFNQVDFFIERGEKIAFIGQNGQGKTTLAKILAGINTYEGYLEKGYQVEIGYFAQNQEEVLNPTHTILEEAEAAATEHSRPRVRDLLGTFLFQGDDVYKKISVLSGGERNRLALCKLLLQPFNTLIMDEPTNHLDIQSKEIIKQALQNFKGTIILVSHDREFLHGLANKIFEFRNHKVKEFLGNIEEYLEYRQKENLREVELEKADKLEKAEKSKELNTKEESNYINKERKENDKKIKKIEDQIISIEEKIQKLEEIFMSKNPSKDQLIEYEGYKKQLAELNQEWNKTLEDY